MGNLCSCDDNQVNVAALHSTILQEEQKRKDPIVQELCSHLRMINKKLENNLTAVGDFKQLLLESKAEIDQAQAQALAQAQNQAAQEGSKGSKSTGGQQALFFQTVLKQVSAILAGFDEAKSSIKMVGKKNSQIKTMLDQMEKDLNTLRNKSRRHWIQSNMSLASLDSQAVSNHMLQSGPTQHMVAESGTIPEYQSMNSHGALSSILQTSQHGPQFSEEENDIIMQKDRIFKKVSDLFAQLKQGEDEAQIQMLNWENFVIQQEKMEKLRQDIRNLHSQTNAKLESYAGRINHLKATLRFFSQTCQLVSTAFLQADALNQRAKNYKHPMSPGSKGDGTTVATERDQDLMGGQTAEQPYSSMLQSRRSLSIGSGHELQQELTSSASQVSMGTDVHENIDFEETEQSLIEVKMLQKHIGLFENKIDKSEKVLSKRMQEQAKTDAQVIGSKIYESDIYELDSLHNSMTDFLNNLEMSLHKLSHVEHEIENIRQNQSLLDFCESVCNREKETALCLHRLKRLSGKAVKLQEHLITQPEQPISTLKGLALQSGTFWFKDSCKEMLIRLSEVNETMLVNQGLLKQIKESDINVESHDDLEESLANLASASNRCKDANRIILDMTFRYCQLYILSGCYGRVVRTQPLFEQKQEHLGTLKHSLDTSQRLLENQMRQCNQFANPQMIQDSPLTKTLSFITEEDLSPDHDQIVEAIRKKTQMLQGQQTVAMDYLNDIEAMLETWYLESEGQSGSFNVLENVEEEDQERPVQELITIDRSINKLVLMVEKIDLLVDKNERLMHKVTLKIKSETLLKFCDQLLDDVTEQYKQAIKLEERLKAFHQGIQKRVSILQSCSPIDDSTVASRSVPDSLQSSELEESQISSHMASVQLMTIDSVINNLQQKESQARQLKSDLVEMKEQITVKLYKSMTDYLAMFPSTVQERDPTQEARLDHQMILSSLEDRQSLQQLGSKVPLLNINRQVSDVDANLLSLSSDVKTLTNQMKTVLDFFSRASHKERQQSQSLSARGRSQDKSDSQPRHSNSLAAETGQGGARNRSYPARTRDGTDGPGEQTTIKRVNPDGSQQEQENKLILGTPSDWSSDRSQNAAEMRDEIDLAINKCLEDQSSLKKLRITKVSKGQYLLENKEYTFKLLSGNNLAIRMHAGYIYADCLVHFEEELYKIVK